MNLDQPIKYFHYTPQRNSNLSGFSSIDTDKYNPDRIKSFKIKVWKKLIYIVEVFYFNEYVFIKFHPKLYENHPEKYQMVGMGLSIFEIRRLLNTCCRIIINEMKKNDNSNLIYAFFGQWYYKDNEKERLVAKRFNLYRKQVTTFFSDENFWHYEQNIINFYCISPKQNSKYKKQIKYLLSTLADDMKLTTQFMTDSAKKSHLIIDYT